MGNENDAFLAEIRSDPEDIIPRLVYADWLEEQGDPVAELIRVQCDLADLSIQSDRRKELRRRETELLEDYRERWIEPLKKFSIKSLEIRRGFVEEVKINAEDFIAGASELVESLPALCSLNLRKSKKQISRLAEVRELEQVRFLDLRLAGLVDSELKTLLDSPHLNNLVDLNLRGNSLTADSAKLIAKRDSLHGLRSLNLAANPIKRAGLNALGKSQNLSNLKRLDCDSCSITAAGVNAFDKSTGLPSLEFLELSGNTLAGNLKELSERPPTLKFLGLTRASLSPDSAKLIAESASLSNLKRLTLRASNIGAAGLAKILASPHFGRLQDLDVTSIDREMWTRSERRTSIPKLRGDGEMQSLKRLRVDGNDFDGTLSQRLIESGCLETLSALGTEDVALTDQDFQHILANTPNL